MREIRPGSDLVWGAPGQSWSKTWTFYEGDWHEGNLPIMGVRDHATWLCSSVFDGARTFEGVSPDLDTRPRSAWFPWKSGDGHRCQLTANVPHRSVSSRGAPFLTPGCSREYLCPRGNPLQP